MQKFLLNFDWRGSNSVISLVNLIKLKIEFYLFYFYPALFLKIILRVYILLSFLCELQSIFPSYIYSTHEKFNEMLRSVTVISVYYKVIQKGIFLRYRLDLWRAQTETIHLIFLIWFKFFPFDLFGETLVIKNQTVLRICSYLQKKF